MGIVIATVDDVSEYTFRPAVITAMLASQILPILGRLFAINRF
ncbi:MULTISPECIES: hypothetical protein [Burkholderia]|nr:hypothetical protein [Burkholderia seminalis]